VRSAEDHPPVAWTEALSSDGAWRLNVSDGGSVIAFRFLS
jgi:hypothetical protein